jgi:hypothetical protein
MTKLRDPEECSACHAIGRFRVVDSRRRGSLKYGKYRRKVHRCRECGYKWEVFVSTIDPKRVYAA